MPYRRRHPKRVAAKKRVYRKKRIMKKRQNNPSKMVFRPKKSLGAVAPERYLTKLKATWLSTATAATGGQLLLSPIGNSPYDYMGGSGTANAAGLTELSALYDRYVCYGSKIVAEVCNSSTTNKFVVLYPYNQSSPSNLKSSIDAPYAKSKMLGANTGQGKVILSNYMSSKRIFGAKDLKDEKEFTALTNATPASTWNWVLVVDTGTGTGTDIDTVRLTITYYVEFFDRKNVNES